MEQYTTDFLIIGAGLSGLTSAYQLKKNGVDDFLVVDSRNRVGGRIHTKNGVDFGATWFQNHHTNISKLLNDLNVHKFHQYVKGTSVLVYNTMAPAHMFESDPSVPSAFRIADGSMQLIDQLKKPVSNKIRLHETVEKITAANDGLKVETTTAIILAKKVISTIPPRLTTRIIFEPALPENVMRAMNKTHTWMSNAMKIGLTFKRPFWKENNYSGTIIGQVGPVVELYDHTNYEENHFALMGFINEGLRELSTKKRKERILEYLSQHLGKEILNYVTYEEKDWSADKHTACETIKSVYLSPEYGNPVFQKTYMNDRLIFSGAETATQYGGYMDGAVSRGTEVVRQILN